MDFRNLQAAQRKSAQDMAAWDNKGFSVTPSVDAEIEKLNQRRGMLSAQLEKQYQHPPLIDMGSSPSSSIRDWSGFEFDSPQTKQNKIQAQQIADQQAFSLAAEARQNAHQEQMQAESLKAQKEMQAENQAFQAAHSGGGGGCFITTATVNSLGISNGEDVLNEFRYFRDDWLKNQPNGDEIIARYYDIAPKIVSAMGNLKSVYGVIWEKYLKPCREFIQQKNNAAAFSLYREMCLRLESKFL
jgi:hypothetical protein